MKTILLLVFLALISPLGGSDLMIDGKVYRRQDLSGNGMSMWRLDANGEYKLHRTSRPDTIVTAIFSFNNAPLASSSRFVNLLQDEHERFRQALHSRNLLSTQTGQNDRPKILHEYRIAFNGVAVNGRLDQIQQLANLSMVSGFSLERTFHIFLKEGVHQIEADRVVSQLGFDGTGVLVGIIDTGIDYQHESLGAGFGFSKRVVSGYDFYNDDPDPMDDHGHGTHVAGIVGANRYEFKGVAPNVQFLAVKVLNQNGSGRESDILAGIEYCLDPDGDPATHDGVDIINMSLGAPPLENDPLLEAVENATNAGVLCVASVGNVGMGGADLSGFETISSPAAAQSALAVGSCNNEFVLSAFSSKGPTAYTYLIKPDIVAPGEQITSSWLNNTTKTLDGTSMSAPHASGTAALLKQQYPSWSPAQLKAALVNSGRGMDITNGSPYSIGNGCINAWKAATRKILVQPGILNFRPVDLNASAWRDTLSLMVSNLDSVPCSAVLEIMTTQPGIKARLSAEELSLAAGDSQTVQVELEVDQDVKIVKKPPFGYTGKIVCISDGDSLTVPFGFIKSNVMSIEFNRTPHHFFIYSPAAKYYSMYDGSPGETVYAMRLPTGVYNIFTTFEEIQIDGDTTLCYHLVERQDVEAAGFQKIFISSNEATWPVYWPVDRIPGVSTQDDIIYINYWLSIRRNFDNAAYLFFFDNIPSFNRLFVSPLSEYIKLEADIIAGPPNDPIILNPFTNGVANAGDVQLSADPSALSRFYIQVDLEHPDAAYAGLCILFASTEFNNSGDDPAQPGAGYGMSTYSGGWTLADIIPESIRLLKSTTEIDSAFFRYLSIGSWEPALEPGTFSDWMGKFRMQKDGRLACFDLARRLFKDNLISNFLVEPNDTLIFSKFNSVLIPVFFVNPGHLVNPDYGDKSEVIAVDKTFNRGFRDFQGVMDQNGYYSSWSPEELFHGSLIDAGVNREPLKTENSGQYIFYPVNMKSFYRLYGRTIPYNLSGQIGMTSFDFSFGFHVGIPCVDIFQISVDNKPAEFVTQGKMGIIRFMPYDEWDHDITRVSLSLLPPDGESIKLEDLKFRREYRAVIPDTLPHGFYDVAALVEDAKGSRLKVIMQPGFFFGTERNEGQLTGRLFVESYSLVNSHQSHFNVNDTLQFEFKFKSFGSKELDSIGIFFPGHPQVKKLGELVIAIDRMSAADSVELTIPFLITSVPEDTGQVSYSFQMQWRSNGIFFKREFEFYIPVDIQNLVDQRFLTPATDLLLQGNYPNPFNNETVLAFFIAAAGHVTVEVFNINGQLVRTLVNCNLPSGEHNIPWDGLDMYQNRVSSGLYLCKVRVGDKQSIGKMVVQR